MYTDIEKKLNGFEYNAYLRTDDIHCIIKYDSEKTYQTEEHPEKCDYYIIRRNLNNYYILGLVKQGIKYRPVTSRIYDDFNEFNRFMLRIGNKQDFTYPYQYKVENPTTGFMIPSITLKLTDRKEILDKIMNISKRYSGVTSVASDYSAFINRTSNNYQRNNNEREVLRILISTIYGNDVLSNDVVQNVIGEDSVLSDDIRELIDAWNNSIVSRSNDGLASNIYSTMESNYFKEKEKNQELTQNLKEAQEKIAELEIEKQALYETNEKNSAKVKVLTDAFDMVNNM